MGKGFDSDRFESVYDTALEFVQTAALVLLPFDVSAAVRVDSVCEAAFAPVDFLVMLIVNDENEKMDDSQLKGL